MNGIKSCISKVASAVTSVADKIRSFLHFSVPDEGPLADFESWMPDFMQGLADGINSNVAVVQTAVNGLSNTLSTGITSSMQGVQTAVTQSWDRHRGPRYRVVLQR